MKKGMTIALLMVAMVALAATASAVAPVIQSLPSVIIGDAGDVSGTGSSALHLLRYENIVDLAGAVQRTNNPTTTTFMKVFYTITNNLSTATACTVKAGNGSAIATAMTDTDVANLYTKTAPASAKQINRPATDTAFSLINDYAGTIGSIHAATPDANGKTEADLTADHALDPQTLTLFATDYFMATDQIGSGTMVVYSVLGNIDSPSPQPILVHSCNDLTTTGHDGFVYNDQKLAEKGAQASLQDCPATVTATGIGFKGRATFSTGKNQGYSSWEHTGNGTVLADMTDTDGKVFEAIMMMSGNATAPTLCPSYRVLFASTGFAHVGGFQVTTKGGNLDTDSAPNMPTAASGPVEARIYWGVPKTTNQYGDGEKAATFDTGMDRRAYYMTFDIMQGEAGDIGTICMNSLNIWRIVRPSGAGASIAWGTGARDFNSATAGWVETPNDGATGWGQGKPVVVAADGVSLAMQTVRTSVFSQVSPVPNATSYPVWVSHKLLRMTYTLTSSNVAACPQIRMLILPWVASFNGKMGNTMWGEALDPTVMRTWYPASSGVGLASSPKTPADGGSTVESYAYTMTAPTDSAELCVLTPLLDIDQPSGISFPQNGWTKPNATVTIKYCSMEMIKVD